MSVEVIKKEIKVIEDNEKRLLIINDNADKINIELRVFTKDGWCNIDFIPKNEAIKNMVIHQIRIDSEMKIKQSKELIKKIVNHEKSN